ncbi:UNVERIFIED_CONTAM: Synaptonemal complex protein ZEP1 [Sesamum radiatum]|uniref:Synaptonemal complex protein ZEP1 n=1 Tax=Sesamum radiatum TaxID=300843 RepID=A0AAW2M794_SESRA
MTEQIHVLEEKLQNAFNENAKLKVKQKEDEKNGKDLNLSSLQQKTLCDQLTETLQQLNVQVQNDFAAEKDKAFFEDKLSATSVALDKLHEHMKSMSLRLDSSEETIKTRETELMELGLAKEKMESCFRNEQNRTAHVIEEKGSTVRLFIHFLLIEADVTIKQLEEDVAANKVAMESLTSKMEKLHFEMRVKEDDMQQLSISKEKLENENKDLLSSKNDFANRLEMALKEIKKLRILLTYCLAQQERDLVSKNAKQKFDQMHNQCTRVISEKNALQLVNHELNNKVLELQKEQEFAMVQHAEECRLAEEKIRKLESEAETLVSKQTEMQALIVKLEMSSEFHQKTQHYLIKKW